MKVIILCSLVNILGLVSLLTIQVKILRNCVYKSGEKVIEIINVGRGLFLDHLGLLTVGALYV